MKISRNPTERFNKYFEVLDLPKGQLACVYYPPRPAEMVIWRKGIQMTVVEVCSLLEPLQLNIGDRLFYNGELPHPFLEFTKKTTVHPIYGLVRVNTADSVIVEQPKRTFVGKGPITYVGSTLSA